MYSWGTSPIRIKRLAPILAMAWMVLFVGCSSHNKALVGSWNIVSYAGKPIPVPQTNKHLDLELLEGGRYTNKGVGESGTWSVVGTTLTLHKETVANKTQSERLDALAVKYASDPDHLARMTKRVKKLYEDWILTVSPDNKMLTLDEHEYNVVITFQKRTDDPTAK